jgi:hypothetical protein
MSASLSGFVSQLGRRTRASEVIVDHFGRGAPQHGASRRRICGAIRSCSLEFLPDAPPPVGRLKHENPAAEHSSLSADFDLEDFADIGGARGGALKRGDAYPPEQRIITWTISVAPHALNRNNPVSHNSALSIVRLRTGRKGQSKHQT